MRQNISNNNITKEAAEAAIIEYQENTKNEDALALICKFAEQCCKKSSYLKKIPVDDRDDISQDVIVRMIEKIEKYDAKRNESENGTSVQAWINWMILSICNDELRKKTSRAGGERISREYSSLNNDKYTESLSFEGWSFTNDSGCHKTINVNPLTCGNIAGPEETYSKEYMRENLYEAIAQLPERYAKVINLYYFDEWSVKEIAKELGDTESAIKKVLIRARSKMRDCIEDYDLEIA